MSQAARTSPSNPESQPTNRPIDLPASWLQHLGPEFAKPYMTDLRAFLHHEKAAGKQIFPPSNLIFNAFNTVAFEDVRVVILGQDPYHNIGQAHGLSFSVPSGIDRPPSLRNMVKEIEQSLGVQVPSQGGDLTSWVQQGVLLLNATLTVEAHQAGSHQNKGWESFTDAVVEALNTQHDRLIFFLWGSYARRKGANIDRKKHLVLEAPHPSPLSAHRGFFGCEHFAKANADLAARGQTPINWADIK